MKLFQINFFFSDRTCPLCFAFTKVRCTVSDSVKHVCSVIDSTKSTMIFFLNIQPFWTIFGPLLGIFGPFIGPKWRKTATISKFLLNKCIPMTWVLFKDRQSWYWEVKSPKLHGNWHFTIKNGPKNIILAIFSPRCKKRATFPQFYEISASQ